MPERQTHDRTAMRYEKQTGPWVDSPWRPFDPEAMGMNRRGLDAFRRFSRLLNDGRARKFNFARYQPRVGTRMSIDGNESTRVRLRKKPADDMQPPSPR